MGGQDEFKKMMGIETRPIQEDDSDSWLLTYSDMVTLLLCFFAVLISFSKIDVTKIEQITQHFTEKENRKMTMAELSRTVSDFIVTEGLGSIIDVELTPKGVEVNLKDNMLFDSGKSELKKKSLPVLLQISRIINHPDFADRIVSVEGHTDSRPIKTERFPSNWELSTSRAASVVRYFISTGLNSKKFEASGYANSVPRASEVTSSGRQANRRVVVVITPDSYYDRIRPNLPIS